MTKSKRKPKLDRFEGLTPTPEQLPAFAETWQIADGKRARAYRRVVTIENLLARNAITFAEYVALAYYRSRALKAEEDVAGFSSISPEKMMGGRTAITGSRLPATLRNTPAIVDTNNIEMALGALRPLARSIAVEDKTIDECICARNGAAIMDASNDERKRAELLIIADLKVAADRIVY